MFKGGGGVVVRKLWCCEGRSCGGALDVGE